MSHPCNQFIIGTGILLISFFAQCSTLKLKPEIDFAASRYKEYLFEGHLRLSWQKANEHCRGRGMFLVSIHNAGELEAVIEEINRTGYWNTYNFLNMWTSLNDIDEEGQYYWAATGTRNKFERWRDGEPNNAVRTNGVDEDCVVLVRHPSQGITSYVLDDRACFEKYSFMCETLDQ